MIEQAYNGIVTPELLEGAIENRGFAGFLEDYHVLHCLIRKYKPRSFLEIGTCDGTGTKIIKNAIGDEAIVFSLDLPTELIDKSLRVNGGDRVGKNCNLPFIQLRGDSMTFDFSKYPCEGYFVDGAHFYPNVFKETREILKLSPKIIIYHDADITEVYDAINYAMFFDRYNVYRVVETRIAYALRKDL